MNLKLKTVLEAAAGALGGFASWVIIDVILRVVGLPLVRDDEAARVATAWDWLKIVAFGAIMGCAIGAAIGVIEGQATGSRKQFNRAVGIGALIGAAGGMVGFYFGQQVFAVLMQAVPQNVGPANPLPFIMKVLARSIGWALAGIFIGAAQGVPSAALRKIKHGAIGGLVGGALGGALFQFVGELPGFSGISSRFVGMIVTGAFIGLFVGLVQDLLKQAWVKVLRGRNEGREYVLDKPVSTLGRDELADIGVFGDPAVAPRHAVIKQENGYYFIEDLGSAPAGTLVNGQRVAKQGLADGDVIQVGGVRVEFHEKVGRAPIRQPRDVAAPVRMHGPAVADNTCAFCGQPKDPRTGACACTPVAQPLPGLTPLAQGGGLGAPAMEMSASGMGVGAAPGVPIGASAGGPRLVCLSGPLSGQVIPIAGAPASIGREPGREVLITGDATVSRRHATVRPDAQGYVIADEGSANGTYVNGARVTTHPLRNGDRIRIGQSEFLFES